MLHTAYGELTIEDAAASQQIADLLERLLRERITTATADVMTDGESQLIRDYRLANEMEKRTIERIAIAQRNANPTAPTDRETEGQGFTRVRINELRDLVKRKSNSESLLNQAQALAYLFTNLSESPSEIDHEMLGTAGGLMEDLLVRLDLAITEEDYAGVDHG